jgi:hypothetical protein
MQSSRAKAAISLALALLVSLSLSGLVDSGGHSYTDAALKRAVVTFAIARTLNGVISVAQETEFAFEPAGIGVTIMPGELLDPINDLIERFSWVMLTSSASIGIQGVLLRMSEWWGVSLLLSLAAGLLLFSLWSPRAPGWLRRFSYHAVMIALFLRFAVPVLLLATSLVSDIFLREQAEQATAALQQSSREIREELPQAEVEAPKRSFGEKLSELVARPLDSMDLRARIERIQQRVSRTIESIIDLIVAFTLETIIIPLIFLWLLIKGFKRSAGGNWL